MKSFQVKKGSLNGEIFTPPSKSQTLRAILFATLAKGKSVVYSYLSSPDTDAMIKACEHFGAKIDLFPDRLEITGTNGQVRGTSGAIDSGNSGIILRFCSAIAALSSYPVTITGDHSIQHQRPMGPILEGLTSFGVKAYSTKGDGFAPLVVEGPLKSGKAEILGHDSQPVSALLIATAFGEGPFQIKVKDPGEKPWVALTLHWFDRLGIPYEQKNYEEYFLLGKSSYEGFEYTVPGDFSSAAFPLVAALVTKSELTIKNIDMQDPQGDKALIPLLQQMGADIEIDEMKRELYVKKGGTLSGCAIDINNFVDAITILSVLGCFVEGEMVLTNGAVARTKECDRIASIVKELKKMGAKIEERRDGLVVQKSSLRGTHVDSYNDHRMAMSLAVAGLGAAGTTVVSPVDCVAKTFPTFLTDFQKLGGSLS